MKKSVWALFVCCLALFAAGPALAELSVTFVNRTDFEIQAISIKGDGGGMSFTVKVVPGNSCVFVEGNSRELHEVTIDAGLMLFSFADMAALAGNDKPTLELSYDANDRPHLTLVDKPAAEGDFFDLEAGPIANNSHAQKRCPEVAEEWLAANPGKQIKWNGNWATVTHGEMSVCGMTILGGGAEAPAPPSLINFVGTASAFADPLVQSDIAFTAITSAGTMGKIRAMGGKQSPIWDSQVYLPAAFAGKTWAVFVEPEETFSRADSAKPGECGLRTYTGGSEGLGTFLQNLAAEGYRPWYAQLTAGEDMDTKSMVKLWEETRSAQDAWEQVADACADVNRGGKPAAVDTILLTEQGYASAAAGENPAVPGLRLRVSNADVITIRYLPDASQWISMTR